VTKINILTNRKIKHIRKAGDYCDGQGLWLQVNQDGRKSWVLRISIRGKRRHMGLGSLLDDSENGNPHFKFYMPVGGLDGTPLAAEASASVGAVFSMTSPTGYSSERWVMLLCTYPDGPMVSSIAISPL
jgi:hypothetical protein